MTKLSVRTHISAVEMPKSIIAVSEAWTLQSSLPEKTRPATFPSAMSAGVTAYLCARHVKGSYARRCSLRKRGQNFLSHRTAKPMINIKKLKSSTSSLPGIARFVYYACIGLLLQHDPLRPTRRAGLPTVRDVERKAAAENPQKCLVFANGYTHEDDVGNLAAVYTSQSALALGRPFFGSHWHRLAHGNMTIALAKMKTVSVPLARTQALTPSPRKSSAVTISRINTDPTAARTETP